MRRSKRSVSDFPCSEEYKRNVSQGTRSCAEVMSLVIEDCKSPCDLMRYMFGQFSGFSSSSRPTHVVIGHFRIVLCLLFKARPRAKPFIWKRVLSACEWKFIFIWKAMHQDSLWKRHKATRKWPIEKRLFQQRSSLGHSSSTRRARGHRIAGENGWICYFFDLLSVFYLCVPFSLLH